MQSSWFLKREAANRDLYWCTSWSPSSPWAPPGRLAPGTRFGIREPEPPLSSLGPADRTRGGPSGARLLSPGREAAPPRQREPYGWGGGATTTKRSKVGGDSPGEGPGERGEAAGSRQRRDPSARRASGWRTPAKAESAPGHPPP